MMDILFNTLYTVRSRNWYLISSCISVTTLLAFAYNNINYVRCLTGMLSMSTLNGDFSEIDQEFVAGNFPTQLSYAGKFSRCETDKVIEINLNRVTKTPVGMTGFSENTKPAKRW